MFTPLLGALVLLCVPRTRGDLLRRVANGFGLLGVAVVLSLFFLFHSYSAEPFQFVTDANWIPSLEVHFRLGLDGISLLMIALTTVLGAVAIFASWPGIQRREKEYYVLLLLAQTSFLGVFMALDFFLFYVFWVVALVPIYLLIAGWGGSDRARAAMRFILYTLAGSLLMLLAILALYHARGTFDMREILQMPFGGQSGRVEFWIFWGFFLAFAIKLPIFPFHSWLADAMSEAPTAVSVLIAGVLLNTGAYGLLRICVPMFPDATLKYRGTIVVLSLIAIVYGALLCLTQNEMKRMIAYLSLSQMGFCTLGIFALTPSGLNGSVIQQVSHGLTAGALLLIAGVLHERQRAGAIIEFRGLAKTMPKLAAVYMIATLAALGLPLFSGFVGEFMILRGALAVKWQWAAWSLLGVVVVAASLLWLYQRTMFGIGGDNANDGSFDLMSREIATLLPLLALSFFIGVYPAPLVRALLRPTLRIVEAVKPGSVRSFLRLSVLPGATPSATSPVPEAK